MYLFLRTKGLVIAVCLFGSSTLLMGETFPSITVMVEKSNITRPAYATHSGDGTGRLFVIEQPGRIQILQGTDFLATPFLDIDSRVAGGELGGGEQGLLGLAFPPGFSTNQHFYVYYVNNADNTVLARYHVSEEDPNIVSNDTEQILLEVDQPQGNHNGGHIEFGPDGYLYVAIGDGGGGHDDDEGHGEIGNGQDRQTLLGKILRIDVESPSLTTGYLIPASNPFVGDASTLDEIWALGLRNPYRMSFDSLNGDLYIGDVGQWAFEEVDYQPASSLGGENYGWRPYEGNQCTQIQNDPCATNGFTFPIHEYAHSASSPICSVIGGFVHRGAPEWTPLHGTYIYGDYCSGQIWGLKKSGSTWTNELLRDLAFRISGFGQDEQGNLYVCELDLSEPDIGRLWKIVDTTTFVDSDADTMPDAYELFYGFETNNSADALEDDDNDGMSNLEELLAGTNPTNENSTLTVDFTSVLTNNEVVLRWPGVHDRTYTVSRSSNPQAGFSVLATNIPALPSMNVYTDDNPTAEVNAYRIEVEVSE